MTAAQIQNQASSFWEQAAELFSRLESAGVALAVSPTVSDEVEAAFEAVVRALPETPDALSAADPYLVGALYAGAMHGLSALRLADPTTRRRALRIPLERVRQAMRDLLAEEPVMEDRPSKQVAQWLLANDELPRVDLARILDVSPSTLRRWADPSATASPRGDEARKLRILARVINQLRWSFTSPGVIEWLVRPHPSLKGDPPETLLEDPEGGVALVRLAAGTRAMTLT